MITNNIINSANSKNIHSNNNNNYNHNINNI